MDQNKQRIDLKDALDFRMNDTTKVLVVCESRQDGSFGTPRLVLINEGEKPIMVEFASPEQMSELLYVVANSSFDLYEHITGKNFLQTRADEEEEPAQHGSVDEFIDAMQEPPTKLH